MKIINLEDNYPTVNEAKEKLLRILIDSSYKTKVFKVIHGYGSTGAGGKIKKMVLANMKTLKSEGKIKDFLPGEAIKSLMGYDQIIIKYKSLIKDDRDFKSSNEGITFVFI